MENHKGIEREISVKELFWSFLFGWRRIVCLGIIFGILLTGFQYLRDMRGSKENTEDEMSLEEEFTENEINEIENIQTLRREVKRYREYLDSSTLMKIDPYNQQVLELQYKLWSDYIMNYTQDIQQDYTADLISMYNRYLTGEKFRKGLIEGATLDITAKDLKELIGVSRENNMIYITVSYPESEKFDTISATIKELLNDQEKKIQEIGSHTLKFIEEEQYSMVNENLIEKKNTILSRIATLNVQINQLRSSLTEEQKDALDKEKKMKDNETLIQPGLSKKYVVIGVALGILLAGIWIVGEMLFSAKLQSSEEVRSLYGECLYGEVWTGNSRKRFLPIIDDKLTALRYRKRKKLSLEQQMDVVCTNVAISCKRQNIGSIYITGSEYENMDAFLLELLRKKLQKLGIETKDGENMCYNDISMKQGGEIGNILLVEQIGKSIYDEIFHEIQFMKEQDMKTLGVIVFV